MPYTHLTAEERETIARMQTLGHSRADIATALNRDPSTISRELRRNADATGKYAAIKADRKASRRRQTCKLPWKFNHAPLKEFVLEKLRLKWSPEQISGQLRLNCDPCMQVTCPNLLYHALREFELGNFHRVFQHVPPSPVCRAGAEGSTAANSDGLREPGMALPVSSSAVQVYGAIL